MERLEQIVAGLPEAVRVDVEAWDGHPTFRVNGKSFVFSDVDASGIRVKLDRGEAAALVATDPAVEAADYGLGRAGWVKITLGRRVSAARWREIEEWVRTSYLLIAPKRLSRQIAPHRAERTEQRREQPHRKTAD
jgi:predicted DNA-binding protein (MmcQ/YjbR family)